MNQCFLILDVGSTATKALVIGRQGDNLALLGRAEAPTTVEEPFADVTVGARNAVRKLEELLDTSFDYPLEPKKHGEPVRFFCTSSAGGGLQVMVCGMASKVTAASAERAALGAGAVILDCISVDEGRSLAEKVEALRLARPDIVLLSGGVEGGKIDFALELCELVRTAKPTPRFGSSLLLPVIYAGNSSAGPIVKEALEALFDVEVIENLRPTVHDENLGPVREAIHEKFLSHVMQHAPGYETLKRSVEVDIMPTPLAFGKMIEHIAAREGKNVLAVDIGGATTDVFSVLGKEFKRTVSANLGMSYSVGNVLHMVGRDHIARWLPFPVDMLALENSLAEKMIRPSSLPATLEELVTEQAVAREALRLALQHHRDMIVSLPKEIPNWKKALRTQDDNLIYSVESRSEVDLSSIGLVIGSGGVLSHAPRRAQAAMIMIDALDLVGVTALAVDSVFMLPHLGTLSMVDSNAAMDVCYQDCLIQLGTVVSLQRQGSNGQLAACVMIEGVKHLIWSGQIAVIPQSGRAEVSVACSSGYTICGSGSSVQFEHKGGEVGIIIDARAGVESDVPRHVQVHNWLIEIGAYTEAELGATALLRG